MGELYERKAIKQGAFADGSCGHGDLFPGCKKECKVRGNRVINDIIRPCLAPPWVLSSAFYNAFGFSYEKSIIDFTLQNAYDLFTRRNN